MTTSQSTHPLADLHDLCSRLAEVHHSIQSYDVTVSPQLPSVIDASDPSSSHNSKHHHDAEDKKTATHGECLPGLRFLREEVKRDCEALEKFLHEHSNSPSLQPRSAPSTNAPYLIAVWNELAHAARPVAIYRSFSPQVTTDEQDGKSGGKWMTAQTRKALKSQTRAVKVDVVAENGARWVRVNTIKNSRIMMEFREIDPYLTSDGGSEEGNERPCLAQTKFDNSVLKMGRELLAAAKANPISVPAPLSGTVPVHKLDTGASYALIPKVTIRLTRLDPVIRDHTGAEPDPRIEQTIRCLREMGVDVPLGERLRPHSASSSERRAAIKILEPTKNVNLDLSALIALISDIAHSQLPSTEEDAHTRFVPPQRYVEWKKDRVKLLARQSQVTPSCSLGESTDAEDEAGESGGTWEDSGQHSRALATQAIREMEKGILDETHERLSAILESPEDNYLSSTSNYQLSPPRDLTGVRFWTTNEARQRCLQIVSKIGGRRERQRAYALLGSDLCSQIPAPHKPLTGAGENVQDTDTRPTYGNPHMKRYASESPCCIRREDAYWEHSRYPARFLPLVPIHVFPSTLPSPDEDARHVLGRMPRNPIFEALFSTCTRILSLGITLVHATTPISQIQSLPFLSLAEKELEGTPPAARPSLPKLTTHTVSSMLAGSSRGYTTLTTNRSSVKAVMKEMRRVYGRGGYDYGLWGKDGAVDEGMECSTNGGRSMAEKAVLWIVDPRSLSEGMRSDIDV
ncbi:hypothetical protein PAXRUDRAFT_131812 [Paxillus rubicundulus Ve08.2h10]|uniref:DUF1308 domain-containing protein n=1 Tax=Paxillus rubicundulus Ve08.2h10 TaxID=930991 RepID=A0A0D0DLP8_9AGAM|nr:hypothetical protein PAXRUDRAFT_131812 [Paxillus rubicundulus Ve08.2h10]